MRPPKFSILTPVYAPPAAALRDTIRSVRTQSWADWEWIIVDDHSPDPTIREILRAAAQEDPRVRVIERDENGHIVVASNDALRAAAGEFIALLDHDDLLAQNALLRAAEELAADEHIDYLYSDEDKVGDNADHFDVFPKPDWSPERLRGQMYTSHLSIMRRELVVALGGFRPGFEGSQDHDLALRVSERARRIAHIREVLYHWRAVPGSAAAAPDAKPYAQDAGLRAVSEHLQRVGIAAEAQAIEGHPGQYRIVRRLDPSRRVSIVIPTIGQGGRVWGEHRAFVADAVQSMLATTDHENVEIVVVYDPPTPPEVLERLRRTCGERLVLVPFLKPFNYSEKMNVGFLASSGDRIVLMNDDVEVREHGWLEQLVAPLDEPSVGMTGAKLFFSDGTIQHAGHVYSRGEYHHLYIGTRGDYSGMMSDIIINREVSGVTAACAAVRRDTFDAVGGFCEDLPVNFNDVDLCHKIRGLGLRILYIANCQLYHFESRSRPRGIHGWEHEFVLSRWGRPDRDPYHPNI